MIQIDPSLSMPHSPGHERDVVSAMLNYPQTFDENPHLTADHFHLPSTRAVFELLQQTGHRDRATDITTFFEEASQKGLLAIMGGPSGISDLLTRPSFPEHIKSHIEKLNQYHGRRLAISAALELARAAFEEQDPQDVLNAAGGPITAVHDAFAAARPEMSTKSILKECFEEYQARLKGDLSPMGIPTLPEIDKYLRGLHLGRVYIIGAYSGGGKSVLSSQIITRASLDGWPVCEINYEMKEKDSMNRKLIQMSAIPSQAFMDPIQFAADNDCPPINEGFIRALNTTTRALASAPIRLVKPSNRQLRTLLSVIRKAVREMGAKIVAIDYLQLVRCKAASAEQEIAEISHNIQEIAQELNIAVLLLSQINEKGNSKHGIVAVEDCDGFLMIENEQDKMLENYGQHYSILLAKDRHNGHGGKTIPLIFDSNKVKFVHGFVDRKKKSSAPKKKFN